MNELSGFEINKNIQNYQTSHVYGKTKNVYCFTAPWNIVLIPKIIDPLTGHEAKGDFVGEFQKLFKDTVYNKFKECIEEYNSLIQAKESTICEWIKSYVPASKQRYYYSDFSKIEP